MEVLLVKEYIEVLSSWWWKIIEGCVTGYESVSCDWIKRYGAREWHACAGTKDKWDKLIIPKEEMAKLHDHTIT